MGTDAMRMTVQAGAGPDRGSIAGLVTGACLPTIGGTALLAALALFQHSSVREYGWLSEALFAVTWIPAFLVAAYGPVLIPFCAAALLRAGRRNVPGVTVGWAFVVVALLAMASGYRWVLDAVELP
jgi:hypothetical protein